VETVDFCRGRGRRDDIQVPGQVVLSPHQGLDEQAARKAMDQQRELAFGSPLRVHFRRDVEQHSLRLVAEARIA